MSDGDLAASLTRRPARKPHRKSRKGCLDCRRRRVKCDEEHPSCRTCVRRNVHCEYPDNAQRLPSPPTTTLDSNVPLYVARSSSSPSASTPATTPLFSLANVTSDTFSLIDLRLLHHWITYTSQDICRCPPARHIWQGILPQIGFKHPYVLHALLGLAALHIAYQNPQERKVRWMDAVDHHSRALDGFQRAVRCITEENSEALFVGSVCNVLYVFALSNPLQETLDTVSYPATSSRNDRILGAEWIPMIRGLEAVLQPIHIHLQSGRISTIMSLGNWFELDAEKNSSDPVDEYFCRTRETWKDSNCSEIYETTLQTLRKCYLYSQQFSSMDPKVIDQWGWNRAWSGPLMFIHFAPEAYFTLLQQRQPPALVLFAFFGALLHKLDDYWFLEGWGRSIVEVVEDVLGAYWKPWISWPLRVVEVEQS
ncbi:hypothetical protein B0J15DRAFT_577887 [Fusarium solani]|uniref:Zn(2)-C6 fungal-type domain-containing protein n=1 Tax=Fusarium solani TaxID=169388 RepID=A0A9P9R726_FUSSL|nr:uncharacterized protein B0J15DRAFT_577887 [Fusarium solani]KAH7268029.1 hypothetical protein B0J15DRAFT_577887 [Fusarium solani]